MSMAALVGPASLTGAGRCLVMGVVNVTPDSFSDGGEWLEPDAAVARGRALLGEGADFIDVGGESTRPGAARVPVAQELARVIPVISRLAADGAVISIDTTRAEVAQRALDAGAQLVNDVSGGLADPAMGRAIAAAGVPYVCMHWRGPPDVMDSLQRYDDVVRDVRSELAARMAALEADGVAREQIILDPGLGFAKSGDLNWPILARLGELVELGRPVVIGASRKRFLGRLFGPERQSNLSRPGPALDPGHLAPMAERDDATAAVTALAAAAGAWAVRVHSAHASAAAVRVVAAWRSGVSNPGG
jgi:dihydropteroate synthase